MERIINGCLKGAGGSLLWNRNSEFKSIFPQNTYNYKRGKKVSLEQTNPVIPTSPSDQS